MNTTEAQTASTWASGSLWLIVVFIGAFVLFGAMMWARARNKSISPKEHRDSEQATRDLYEKPQPHDSMIDKR